METAVNIPAFAASMGFDQRDGELFFGKRGGFSVGFNVVDPSVSPVFLFHIRLPVSVGVPEFQALRYDKEVEELRTRKQLEIDLDDRLTWLTIVDGVKVLHDGSLPRLLDSILSTFSDAGLNRNASLCHYCQREHVQSPMCVGGRVVQICPACLNERVNAPENRSAEVSEGALSIGTIAPLAAAVGAIGWAAFWISYVLLFEFLNTDEIVVPRFVELIALLAVAFGTGGPVGYVIKRVRRRGQILSIGFSIVCSVAAVVVGEVAFIAWLIYREFKVLSPRVAWKILPQVEMEMGGFHLLIKLGAAVLAVVIAVEMAKPTKPKLKL